MSNAHSEAATYLAGLNETTRCLAAITHELFASEGCSNYVKTIYIGYDIDGEMVAADAPRFLRGSLSKASETLDLAACHSLTMQTADKIAEVVRA